MRMTIFTLISAVLIAGILFTACQTPDEKVASAEAKVQDADKNLAAAQNSADSASQKAASAEEWAIFKNEGEAKIKDNQIRIAALKTKIVKSGNSIDEVYATRIDTLEQRNKDMQARIDAYSKKQDAWASFKLGFNSDMDGLVAALKDLADKNK